MVGDEDGLSGLSVQWFGGPGGFLVCQFQSAGVDAWKVAIAQTLITETGCPNVYECADTLIRKGEGLPVLAGVLAGDPPSEKFTLTEDGVTYSVDLNTGLKYRIR